MAISAKRSSHYTDRTTAVWTGTRQKKRKKGKREKRKMKRNRETETTRNVVAFFHYYLFFRHSSFFGLEVTKLFQGESE
jgi:hypothetical protein